MNGIITFATDKVKGLVPTFERLEFRAIIGDNSRAIEFFVTRNGERLQCYELCDNGELDESELKAVFAEIADYIRKSTDYRPGETNKTRFSCIRGKDGSLAFDA